MTLFKSFFLGGFECATGYNRRGQWIDQIAATHHDVRVNEDYRRLVEAGLRAAREAVRWPLVDLGDGRYDFSSVRPFAEAARRYDLDIIWDLLGNALKFRRAGQPPIVRIWSEPDPKPNMVCIYVADNGIGFPQESAERIFGLFERLEGRSQYEGTGVGLAICRKVVERHGGTLTAVGEPGIGATFEIRLPCD